MEEKKEYPKVAWCDCGGEPRHARMFFSPNIASGPFARLCDACNTGEKANRDGRLAEQDVHRIIMEIRALELPDTGGPTPQINCRRNK